MKKSVNKKSLTLLFAGAMNTELNELIKTLQAIEIRKLLNRFPLYKAEFKSTNIYIVKTFVGEHNALIAGYTAIKELNPDIVVKFGTVGGSYPASKTGDIIVPLGFFHRTSWITKIKLQDKPTNDASNWISLFGNLPYQVNKENLGGIPYFFQTEHALTENCERILNKLNIDFKKAYIGGGNIWMFDKQVLDNVANTLLPKNSETKSFVSNMESYSLAYISYLTHKPFTGCYIVTSNDYLDEIYNPSKVSNLTKKLVPYALSLIENFHT